VKPPYLGFGVGLRRPHFEGALAGHQAIDWLELVSDNFMAFGGRPAEVAERAASRYPIALHGVSLSIGSVDPLDEDYLRALYRLVETTGAHWFSDHLCFSSAFGTHYHDLLPLPFTEEALDHVCRRIDRVQAGAPRRGGAPIPFLLENPSYYITFRESEMDEAAFLSRMVERTGCGLLLDVNNVYVNAQNHGYDARASIDALPLAAVGQIHLAGHTRTDELLIDTHGARVCPEVLELYRYVLERTGPVSTLLEWDNDIPTFATLIEELETIRACAEGVLGACATMSQTAAGETRGGAARSAEGGF
jgi:uncharacterized protein